jgi:tRNA pseudouridine13 synthase
MKLRQKPEDFVVEEINEFNISDKGKYKLFLLEKKCIETFSLLGYLSKKNKIPISEFGIAGLKDKHAVTKQYMTVPAKYDIKTMQEQNFKITFLGFVDEQIKSGDLKGNRFIITARDVRKGDVTGIYNRANAIPDGMPNYYDSQRFGSAIGKEFIAKHILQKDYEMAVKIYLTKYTKFESKRIKDEKRRILANWDNLSGIEIGNKTFAKIIGNYLKTKSWLEAYKQIPSNLREMFVSAYQSYLWNECIKQLLKKFAGKQLYPIEYAAGSLLFYKRLDAKIPSSFKTISEDTPASGIEKEIIENVLEKEGITLNDFKNIRITGNFFKTHEREVIVKPSDFKISEPAADELNKNRLKIVLSFGLPKASYATIITKKIFNN